MEDDKGKRRAGKADLHSHSICSDGAHSPEELVRRALNAGLAVLSLTDHDSVNGVDEAIAAGLEHGLEVIPGVELSATLPTKEIHILGYFVDIRNSEFLNAISVFRTERIKRAERIVEKLNKLNIPLKMEDVLAQAGEAAIGRPHIAKAMVQEGHADSYHQVFAKYIGDGGPASVRKSPLSPDEAIRLINAAGGLSFVAHPGKSLTEDEVLELIRLGIDGIEVIHPSHSPELAAHYRAIVNQYYLLSSGGSDYHGGMKGDDHVLGEVSISTDIVDAMRQRLFSRA